MPTLDHSKPDSLERPETANLSSQCNLCGSTEYDVLSKIGKGNEPLNTVICKKCGLVWSHPFPIDPLSYYQKHYRIRYKGTFTPRKKHIFRSAHAALGRFNILKHLLKPRCRVLEVGSGGGEFLYLLEKLGCDAFGIEPNEGYAEYAKREYQLNIKTGFLQNTEFEENLFDIVTLWHVFEHMDNPTDILKKIHSFLAADGVLVIEVPNVESTCQWPGNTFHTAHLYNFNQFTLSRMAERAGFVVVDKLTAPDGGIIRQVFKKNSAAPQNIRGEIDGNFERIKNIVAQRTTLKHYFSLYPYSRVLSKVRQWVREKGVSKFSSGKEILDHLMKNIDRNSLSKN
jgi:2-polyprenyl-3-methyl-5-hydroxy-6-metoxy-1,4-benzoquinol methylase